MDYWVSGGVPKNKLGVGISLYGRGYNLVNINDNLPGAPFNGPSIAGPYTLAEGIYSYYEV